MIATSRLAVALLVSAIVSVPILASSSGTHHTSTSTHTTSTSSHATHTHHHSSHTTATTHTAGNHHHPESAPGERDSEGRLKRSTAAKDAFKREHPCPSTGKSTGACPGYVIDHVIALKRGGKDDPSNMQWQTVADAKAKDKVE